MKCTEFLDRLKTQYRLIHVLSNKNGAQIMRMRHQELGQDMVVKRYDKPVKAYELLKTVRHRNLPEIYDVISCEDGQIVLEEYISGISVANVLDSGKYTYRGAKTVICGVCNGVHTLHEMGIIHRDIKPENVLISREGVVKLIDLNASRELKNDHQTRDTVILGTIGYAPPEQFGVGVSDNRADIYAIGVLLNVMLTGEHPSRCLAKGKAGRIVRKCTLIDPQSRFPNVEKLMQAL